MDGIWMMANARFLLRIPRWNPPKTPGAPEVDGCGRNHRWGWDRGRLRCPCGVRADPHWCLHRRNRRPRHEPLLRRLVVGQLSRTASSFELTHYPSRRECSGCICGCSPGRLRCGTDSAKAELAPESPPQATPSHAMPRRALTSPDRCAAATSRYSASRHRSGRGALAASSSSWKPAARIGHRLRRSGRGRCPRTETSSRLGPVQRRSSQGSP